MNDLMDILKEGYSGIKVRSRISEFSKVKEFVDGICADAKVGGMMRNRLMVVADEIFSNIARFAYPDGVGDVVVGARYCEADRSLVIVFADNGVKYNPLKAPEPDLAASLDDRINGGFGIFLVMRMSENLHYDRLDDANVLSANFVI